MKLFSYSALIILIINYLIYSQENKLFLPQGYLLPSLSGYGYSKTINDVSNIGNMNPASLSSFNSISGGVSYQYDSKINNAWLVDIGFYKNKTGLPQSAGIVYPLNDFCLGVSFTQRFNGSLDFGQIPITTVENPDGTGEFYSPLYQFNLMSYSILGAFSIHNTFKDNDKLSFGLSINLDKFSDYEKIIDVATEGSFYGGSFSLGAVYERSSDAAFLYRLSLFFEKGANAIGNLTIKGSTVTLFPDSISHGTKYNIPTEVFRTSGKIPDKLNIGADFDIGPFLSISSNYSYVFWHGVGASDNRPEISLTGLYKLSDIVSLSVGTYIQQYNNEGINRDFQAVGKLNALYLTAGSVIHYKYIDLNIGIADSHLISGEWRKQTAGTVSLGFHL
jgi:hypothetical protein